MSGVEQKTVSNDEADMRIDRWFNTLCFAPAGITTASPSFTVYLLSSTTTRPVPPSNLRN